MQCLFCKKEVSGPAHTAVCPSYTREVTAPLRTFVLEKSNYVQELHKNSSLDQSPEAIATLLLNSFLKECDLSPEQQSYVKLRKLSATADQVRSILKNLGVYSKSTPSRMSKVRQTMLSKYGVINNGQLPEARAKLSARNNADVYRIPARLGFEEYNHKVSLVTDKSKRKLPAPSRDYYTQLPFLEELNNPFLMQGDLYPTVDHKLSVLYCYQKGLPPEVCGDVSNLCWTFRWLNSLKQHLPEHLFREHLLPLLKQDVQLAVEALIREGYHACE
jgi:hypothetical protein